jgi:arylsulfatase A
MARDIPIGTSNKLPGQSQGVTSGMAILSLALAAHLGAPPPFELPTAPPIDAAQIADGRPNVLLVLADDLGWGDLGCYGTGSRIPTPHLDRLAAEGLRLTDAHSPSAVCTPTRYGLLTGRYAWRTRLERGVLLGDSPNLIDPERDTLADLLAAAGYRTAAFGKWHLGLGTAEQADFTRDLRPAPIDHGFEHFFGIPASLDFEPYVYLLGRRAVQPPTEHVAGSAHRRQGGGGFWRAGRVAPDFRHQEVLPRLGERTAEWIERVHRETPEQPFFAYLALSSPHTPWMPGPVFAGTTPVGYYGDFVAHTDAVVGRVLERLDQLELTDDTLVIFTSDNGSHWPAADTEKYGHAANGPWRGQKADIHEGGHRVPFLVRWPGHVAAGEERPGLLLLTDVMRTLAGLLQLDVRAGQAPDSVDQWAWWTGSEDRAAAPPRTEGVLHSLDGMFALRMGPWKLIEGRGSGGFTEPRRVDPGEGEPEGQLYHLERDPGEAENLWHEHPERVRAMLSRLDAVRAPGADR